MDRAQLSHMLFDRLRAEHEADWLDQVFVEPTDFETVTGMRSTVVFGAGGSGKTALRLALQAHLAQADQPLRHLVVHWQPALPVTQPAMSQAVQTWLTQLLDVCALALLRHIGTWPETFVGAPEWTQETVVWFVNKYLRGDPSLHLSRLEELCPPEGVTILRELTTRPPRPVLYADVPETRVITELVNALQRMGVAGVWVVIDGLEPWVDADAGQLTQMLKAFLATLTLFEEPGFVLKLMLPTEIEPTIAGSGGIVRRRLDVYRLEWTPERLTRLLERRLALVCGRTQCTLADLCTAPDLLAWLKSYGGRLPRGWLELLRPLVETYLARGAQQPLTQSDWLVLQQRHPPRLSLNALTQQVFLGYGEVTDMQPGIYKILCYLYTHRSRLCTRSELFYKAYRGLEYEPQAADDPGWESPRDWSSVIDTLLWRLRKVIEPDPKHPVYIISKRGQGVRLEHVW